MSLRVVFMGTPEFAVPCLNGLIEAGHTVIAAVSQPSKPVGRGQVLTPPPVAAAAAAEGIPVFQWPRLSNESYEALSALAPDLCVVVAYGKILPQRYLDLPRLGCLNVHASLLPRWRGAAPIQWAVIDGDTRTGVCVMRMEAGLDTGPVARVATTAIGPDETAGDLHDRLSLLGADTLVDAVAELEAGRALFRPQLENLTGPDAEAGVTYAVRLEKTHGLLDWTWDAKRLHDRIRGCHPWPGAYVERADGPFKILASRVAADVSIGERAEGASGASVGRKPGGVSIGEPGTIVAHEADGPRVACGGGSIVLTKVQRPGRKVVSGVDFLRGAADFAVGTRL